ncbi:MAG: hypothetical protein H7061_01955 [Bdellovibrionaceae bacterium]|nr:hypothetical protein [Bdellovibrio sp.]
MKKFSLLWILFLAACTPYRASLQSSRWSGEGARPVLNNSEKIKTDAPLALTSADEDVQISQQTISDFKVQNSFLKTVSIKNQGVVFESSALVYNVSARAIAHAKNLNQHKTKSWASFLKKNPEYKRVKLISLIEVIFINNLQLRPVLNVVTESSRGFITSVSFDKQGHLISATPVGSHLAGLVETPSWAYPKGPKKSVLTPILLSRKIQSEGLADTFLEVLSQSTNHITGSANNLEYPVTDDRFDEVQAFYFAHEMLEWFQQQITFAGPFKLQIMTHVGYPEKTNAAFYFRNQIRLGTGDDKVFSKMAWDPSIVMHETSHALIDSIARLPFTGEGGSINEGFADFFTTFYLNSPYLADNSYQISEYNRSVEVKLGLNDRTGALYHDSAIVSSFFWELKNLIGKEKALNLGIHILNRLGPSSDFKDFNLALNEQSKVLLNEDDLKKLNQLKKDRDFL